MAWVSGCGTIGADDRAEINEDGDKFIISVHWRGIAEEGKIIYDEWDMITY